MASSQVEQFNSSQLSIGQEHFSPFSGNEECIPQIPRGGQGTLVLLWSNSCFTRPTIDLWQRNHNGDSANYQLHNYAHSCRICWYCVAAYHHFGGVWASSLNFSTKSICETNWLAICRHFHDGNTTTVGWQWSNDHERSKVDWEPTRHLPLSYHLYACGPYFIRNC